MNKFLLEILQQPKALTDTLNYYVNGKGKTILAKITSLVKTEKYEQIIFTGMGSSYFTSFAASNLFSNVGISSFVINASELLHYNLSVFQKKTLLFCLSQSGESYEVRELQKKISENVTCVAITNTENSTLAQNADLSFLSFAGQEDMTSTKTYVSIQMLTYIIGWAIAGLWDKSKTDTLSDMLINFKSDLDLYQQKTDNALDFMGELNTLQVIARGSSYSTAMQSSLMFKEAVKIAAAGYLGGEFRHGPIEMVQTGFKSVIFSPEGKTFEQNIKMAQDIANFGGKVLLITNSDLPLSNKNILVLTVNQKDEYLFSIQSIIPIQLFIDSYAKKLGFEAGSFAHGTKVTAVE